MMFPFGQSDRSTQQLEGRNYPSCVPMYVSPLHTEYITAKICSHRRVRVEISTRTRWFSLCWKFIIYHGKFMCGVPKTILNFPKPCFQTVPLHVCVGSATRTRWVHGAYVLVFRRVRVSNLTRTRQLTNAYASDYRRVRVDLPVRAQFVRTAYVLCGMAAGWSRGMCMFPTFRNPGLKPLHTHCVCTIR